jgi:hypothetical protein
MSTQSRAPPHRPLNMHMKPAGFKHTATAADAVHVTQRVPLSRLSVYLLGEHVWLHVSFRRPLLSFHVFPGAVPESMQPCSGGLLLLVR